MLTKKRLQRAYDRAKTLVFTDEDKFIFFSDVHKGDNSYADEFAHNQHIYHYALQHYLKEGFSYIELGDGDELWEHKNFEVLRYAHSDVYQLLKEFHLADRLHILYGNHNYEFKNPQVVEEKLHYYTDEYTGEKTELFAGIEIHESLRLLHKESSVEIFCVHGHQGDLMNDQLWWFNRLLLRYFWRFVHVIGFRNPASPAKNVHKRHKIERKLTRWIEENKHMMIVGHTHRMKFPKVDEAPYFNTGCCIHPRTITGIEIQNGQISMIEWSVTSSDLGELVIARKVVRGPNKLEDYDCCRINT